MKTISIVYCIPSIHYRGGMERVLCQKANYLADRLHYNVFIIETEEISNHETYPLSANVKRINIKINFNELYSKSIWKRPQSYRHKQRQYRQKLNQQLIQISPDITVSLLRREINFLPRLKDGSLKIGELHISRKNFRDFKNIRLPKTIRKFAAKLWMNQLIRNVKKLDQFIVLTEEDSKNWPEISNVKVIPNPLSFTSDKKSEGKNKKVLAVGHLVPQKGFDLLIKAWRIVSKEHSDWELNIYGDGNSEKLNKLITELKITGNCHIHPSTSNIQQKYLESSIFVLSSRFEGFGLVLTEAMECGVPVVSFACPCGPKDIINEGKDGFLVPPENIEQLAIKINYLIDNPEIRLKMGIEAVKNVQRYELKVIMKQWDTMFKELIKNNPQIKY